MFADKEVQEKYIMESGLEWTIVRPAVLTNGRRMSNYRAFTAEDSNIRPRISRINVADFMLRQIPDRQYVQKAVSLTY
jgi:uncharacterized protein YbjT (DUF2867 family)